MIIWGTRSRGKALGQVAVNCPNCHQHAMTAIGQSQRWFTLFFIPIFPISGKNTIAACGLCGFRYKIEPQQAAGLLDKGTPAQPFPSR